MKKPMCRLTSPTMGWCPLSFDLQGAFPLMCSLGDLLDIENDIYVIFYLLSGQRSACSPSYYCLHLGVSVRGRQIPADQSGAHLFPGSNSINNYRKNDSKVAYSYFNSSLLETGSMNKVRILDYKRELWAGGPQITSHCFIPSITWEFNPIEFFFL